MTYIFETNLDYVMGHLRYGHAEIPIEANSYEEALAELKEHSKEWREWFDYDIVVDDYEIDSWAWGKSPITHEGEIVEEF